MLPCLPPDPGSGGTWGGSGAAGTELRSTGGSGQYSGVCTSYRSATWTDRAQGRVELSLHAPSNPIAYNLPGTS